MLETKTDSEIKFACEPVGQHEPELLQEDSVSHRKVLFSLKKLKIPGYDILVEQKGNRLDLPNANFQVNQKGAAQRKLSLCYVDAILHANRVPRLLIEVVDNNPTSPNGITGLTVNVDRIAEVHPNIDLLFIVLAKMKSFYCTVHDAGHRLSTTNRISCLQNWLGANPSEDVLCKLIHEGKAANFKKALIDYPIRRYLHNICPPSALFLSADHVAARWSTYESHALRLIHHEIAHILSGKQSETRLAVRELIPESITATHEFVRDQPTSSLPPPPGTEVTWEDSKLQQRVVIKNRGSQNTRVRLSDGRTVKVPNMQLHW
jgi:hypothetical protein